jgi:drug/metabolite transporter (DMT)-like permease
MKRIAGAVLFALIAFAANSVLCRMALRQSHIDPTSFTSIRLLAGAITLWVLVRARSRPVGDLGGSWFSAAALLGYAIAFSFAYVELAAGTGALLLFGAVQVVMIAGGVIAAERIDHVVISGWLLAAAGLVLLLLPGITAPAGLYAFFMLMAGVAWGIYSLRGRRSKDALKDTAGNFVRAAPGALLLSILLPVHRSADLDGIVLAALSGSVASGLGYAAWYTALPKIGAIAAANAQLAVPVITALAGVVLFNEPITTRLVLSSILVLGGSAVAVRRSVATRSA